MEKTATLNLRVNPTLKQNAEQILNRLGIPMSTAVNMFLNQITLRGGIPFPLTLPDGPDELNMDKMTPEQLHARLAQGLAQVERGEVREANEVFQEFWENHQ